jgi:hypothetical protein
MGQAGMGNAPVIPPKQRNMWFVFGLYQRLITKNVNKPHHQKKLTHKIHCLVFVDHLTLVNALLFQSAWCEKYYPPLHYTVV